jgi:colanic acid/amylovoran biosynthesis protein
MTLVLSGVTGLRNRGVEALVRGALEGFARHFPGEPTTVLSADPPYDQLVLNGNATVVADSPGYFQATPVGRYLRKVKAGVRSGGGLFAAIEAIRSATAVVASGGDIFSSDYGTVRRFIGQMEIAQKFGRPTVFLAHSIGPFKTKTEVDMMRTVLEAATLITVRESRSRQYLIEDLRIAADRVRLTADVAFLLKPSDSNRVAGLKRSLGLGNSGYVAIAPSEGITSFSSSAKDRDAHDLAWLRTIERILSSSTDQILIVPHVQNVRPTGDDRRIASRLVEATDYNPRVRVAWGELSASDFKGLIQDSRYFIGERMHACIAALSTAVPTIALGYSVKAQGIMEDLLGAGASNEGLHVPVAQFVASDGLKDEIGRLTQNFEDVRGRLAEASVRAKELADANFVDMRRALNQGFKAAA